MEHFKDLSTVKECNECLDMECPYPPDHLGNKIDTKYEKGTKKTSEKRSK